MRLWSGQGTIYIVDPDVDCTRIHRTEAYTQHLWSEEGSIYIVESVDPEGHWTGHHITQIYTLVYT